MSGDTGEMGESQTIFEDELDIDGDTSVSATSMTAAATRQGIGREQKLMSLDALILRSVDQCPSDELKRKMLSTILLVGGGVRFRGIDRYLTGRLALQVPAIYRSDSMEILVDPKDASSATTAWKGAAVLACLETAQELWISPLEWTKHGSKLLRERAPFPWT